MSTCYALNGLYVGKVSECNGMSTAIKKLAVTQPVYISKTGIEGDECADQRHHGGVERALHQYPAEHYRYWRQKYSFIREWQAPGMGENLSSYGMTEHNVYVGNRYQWGEAIIEVSQPRSPCFKLNKHRGVEKLSLAMQELSLCGWLFRVIQPGIASVNDDLVLLQRPKNAMTIAQVCAVFFGDPLNNEGLLKLKMQTRLSKSWMDKVDARLATRQVENWDFRLFGAGEEKTSVDLI